MRNWIAIGIVMCLGLSAIVMILPISPVSTVNASSKWTETDWSTPLDYESSFNVNVTSPSGQISLMLLNMYITDEFNNRIVRTRMDGGGWDEFGSLGTGVNQFDRPSGIDFDPTTNYFYIADGDNNRIVKTKFNGIDWTSFGTVGSGANQFDWPTDVFYDASSNHMYVVDRWNYRIVRTQIDGTNWQTYGSYGSGVDQFDEANQVYYDSSSNLLYITDTNNDRLVNTTFGTGGSWNEITSSGPYNLVSPHGFGYRLSNDLVYISNFDKMVETSYVINTWNEWQAAPSGTYNNPKGLSVDQSTNFIYICDAGNNRIIKTTPVNNEAYEYGTGGSSIGAFNWPSDIYYDGTGTYATNGTLVSNAYNIGSNFLLKTINWSAITPAGTSLKFQIKSASSEAGLTGKNFVGPDGTIGTFYTTSGDTIWGGHNGNQWIQYKVDLSTTDISQTPELQEVFIIYNAVPFATGLQILPTNPITTDNLACNYVFNDGDGDTESGTIIRWFKNGVLQPMYDNFPNLPSNATLKSEQWNVSVQPYDDVDYGNIENSLPITISNSPPSASGLGLSPLFPVTTDDIVRIYNYNDIDNDTETGTKIRWYMDGTLQPLYNDLTTLPSSATSKGEQWNYSVEPYDSEDYGNIVDSPSVIIENTKPIITNLDLIPTNPLSADDINISYTFNDVDNDIDSESQIRWYKGGTLQSTYNDLMTLPSTATTKGDIWNVTVRPFDGEEYGLMEASPSVTIINTPPIAQGLDHTPEFPSSKDNIIANYTYFDNDNDLENNVEIRWYKNGILQPAFNDQLTLPSSAIAKGDVWYFTVRSYDGEDNGSKVTSGAITIMDFPPTVSGLVLLPSSPFTNIDLTANYTYFDEDGDPEGPSRIKWYKDGVLQAVYNDQLTIPSTATSKGEQWNFSVEPYDGEMYGTISNSATITIANSLPNITDLGLIPSSPSTIHNITISYTFIDADDDIEGGSQIRWYKNDVLQSAHNDQKTLPSIVTTEGEKWYFTVSPHDNGYDADFGTLQTSPIINISGIPPILHSQEYTPTQGNTLTLFIFKITYESADNLAPNTMFINIDGSQFNMSSSDITYDDGSIFTYQTNLLVGIHEYYFEFGYGTETIRDPISGVHNTLYVNTIPILDSGNMTPSSGNTFTLFTFTVEYEDADDDPPVQANVYIDEIRYNMTSLDTSYTDGSIFTYHTKLAKGTHEYYFEFNDGTDSVEAPSPGTFSTPEIKQITDEEDTSMLFLIIFLVIIGVIFLIIVILISKGKQSLDDIEAEDEGLESEDEDLSRNESEKNNDIEEESVAEENGIEE